MSADARRWSAVVAIVLVCAVLQGAGLVPVLRYERAAIGDGELWRLLTGNLVHLGPMHLVLNAVGLVLVCALVGERLALGAWAAVLVLSALGVGAGLWVLDPGVRAYVGLSGVLHGLLAAGALAGAVAGAERRLALVLLGLLMAKLAWEQVAGGLPGTAAASGGPVIVDAHLYGAVTGAAAGGIVCLWSAFRGHPG